MRRILIIDDCPTRGHALAEAIRHLGFHADCSCTAAGAIDHLRGASVDLVILNPLMPRMDGWQVLQWTKTHRPIKHFPVIVTGDLSKEQWQLARQLGASERWPANHCCIDSISESLERYFGMPALLAA